MVNTVSESYCHLNVTGLSIEFSHEGGIYKAVNDISFSLQKGTTLGIVGESGFIKINFSLAYFSGRLGDQLHDSQGCNGFS